MVARPGGATNPLPKSGVCGHVLGPSGSVLYMSTETEWHWPSLRDAADREVARVLWREADRDDAVQEAMVRAWRYRWSCRTPDHPEAWIRQIARREALRAARRSALDAARRADARAEAVGSDAQSDVFERLDARRLVSPLPATDRLLIGLRYDRDLTHRQIAEALGLPVGTVKVRLHRLHRRLRSHMEASRSTGR